MCLKSMLTFLYQMTANNIYTVINTLIYFRFASLRTSLIDSIKIIYVKQNKENEKLNIFVFVLILFLLNKIISIIYLNLK